MAGIKLLNKVCNKHTYTFKSFEALDRGEYTVKFFELLNTKYGDRIGVNILGGK